MTVFFRDTKIKYFDVIQGVSDELSEPQRGDGDDFLEELILCNFSKFIRLKKL